MLKGVVNRRQKGETFLSAVTYEAGSQPLLLELLNDRSPKTITAFRNSLIITSVEDLTEIQQAVWKHPKKALIGRTDSGVFIAAPMSRERMVSALLRSCHTLRMLRTGIRLITTERDLLNKHTAAPPPRAYKDE